MNKVWFITGCSTGFGRDLAKQVLADGYRAVITSRNADDITDIVADYPEMAIAIQLDVTKSEEITVAVGQAVEKFGTIDVLVNNAGIGYFGAIEESDEDQIRKMFEINFFGLANVTKAVLPIMRKQRSGHILNIASIGGVVANPSVGFYNATKFAVDGFSEALSKEVATLGIKVTIIAPSAFRTDWAGRSAADSTIKIDDYKETAGKIGNFIRTTNGKQPGDPVRAAKAMVAVVESEAPPLRLFLGEGAIKGIRNKLISLTKEIDTWEGTTLGADFPKDEQ